jgi:hypothetical protein
MYLGSRIGVASFHAAPRPGYERLVIDSISLSQSDLPVVPTCRTHAALLSPPNHQQISRHPVPGKRGVSRSSLNVGPRGAVDAFLAKDERGRGGRRSRGVLIPRRWYQLADDADASRRGRRQQARLSGETTKETVKTIARGMPGETGVTVVTNARVFYHHARLRRIERPAFPAPLMSRDKDQQSLGRLTSRERGRASLRAIAGRR